MSNVLPATVTGPSEHAIRPAIRESLGEWTKFILHLEGRKPAAHHHLLSEQLQAISDGTIDRLMILMPPGSAKSVYSSIYFPAWWFTQHPASSIIMVSHTASLADHFGRQVRNLVADQAGRVGFDLALGNRAGGRWQTSDRGEYFASGVHGPITGRRADLALIDDPIKTVSDVTNARLRDGLWNWYQSELVTRLKPGGRVVLIMTRWHEDDIAGRLQEREPGQWRVLRLPALAEENDPLGRNNDMPLWPDWESASNLERKRTSVGERIWNAMFQQAPKPTNGGIFRTNCIDTLDDPPAPNVGRTVRAWDLAATVADGGNDPDWTVGVKLQAEPQGRYVVLDVVRVRGSPHGVVETIAATAKRDGDGVWIGLPEDPGQAGKTQIAFFSAALSGYRVKSSPETGAKTTRVMPVASQIEARNVSIVRAAWNHAFLEELRDFPNSRKDDQVDALSRAFSMLTNTDTPARHLNLPFISR